MSDKETSLKEKLRQALASTIRVISDDLEIKQTNKKSKSSNKFDFFELNNLDSKFDFIKARAEADSSALKKKFSDNHKSINLIERPKKLGLGSAYRDGFKWALEQGYKHCIEMDGDFSHTIVDLQNLIKFKDEFDDYFSSD